MFGSTLSSCLAASHHPFGSQQNSCNSFAICSRASMKMRVLTDHRDEGSQLSPNPFTICSYKKRPRNPFIICSYKTLDLKYFRICSYEKTGVGVPLPAHVPCQSHPTTKHAPWCLSTCTMETTEPHRNHPSSSAVAPNSILDGGNSRSASGRGGKAQS